MVTLLHISDLHFGRARARTISEAVLRAEAELKPDAVVCSGDLVEFSEIQGPWREVRTFLRRIAAPLVVTPGNHDIERFNPINRLLRPFERYRRCVGTDIDTVTELPGAVIVGLGTPRRWSFHLGHISLDQLEWAERVFARAGRGALKVVTMHHGLARTAPGLVRQHVWGGRRIGQALVRMGAHLVLSGHAHAPHAARIEGPSGRALVWAQAGTTGSHRFARSLREARNSLSVIRASASKIAVEWWHYVEQLEIFERTEATTLLLPEPVT